jgi:hypothetical protein
MLSCALGHKIQLGDKGTGRHQKKGLKWARLVIFDYNWHEYEVF